MRLVGSVLFEIWFYASMAAMGVVLAPAAAVSRRAAIWAMQAFCAQAFVALRLLCGLRVEVRGPVPQHPCIVAAKHQSFLDVVMLMSALPSPRFVMKKSLVWAPVLGLYALRIGAVPIDRAKGSAALREMKDELSEETDAQIVIYPQGTRTPPDGTSEAYPYRGGAALLARASGLPTVPAATNAGVFWRKGRIVKRPGVAVIEFLAPLEAGLPSRGYMAALEAAVEPAAARLRDEAEKAGAKGAGA